MERVHLRFLEGKIVATLPSTPTAATVGSKITASNWNTQVQLPEEFFRVNRPICVVYQTSAQSIAMATATPVLFDSETLDRDVPGQHSTSTNTDRIVIGTTLGWYRVTGTVSYAGVVGGSRRAFITLNGAALANGSGYSIIRDADGSTAITVSTTALVQATNATDYVQLNAYSSAAINTYVATFKSNLTAEWIGS